MVSSSLNCILTKMTFLNKFKFHRTHYHYQKYPRSGGKRLLNVFLLLILFIVTTPSTYSEKHSYHSSSLNLQKHFSDPYDNPVQEETPSPTVGGCGSCRMLEDIKARSLEMIKEQILKKMGFKKAPNITGRLLPQVPLHQIEMINQELKDMQSDQPQYKTGLEFTEEDDEYHAKTEKLFLFAQKHPRLRHSRRSHDIIYFPLSDGATKYQVSNASLYVYMEGGDRTPLPDILIEVFRVLRTPSSAHVEESNLKLVLATKHVQPFGMGNWIRIDMTEIVSEWFKNSRENHGLIVKAELAGKKIIITDTEGPEKGKVPYMEVTPQQVKRRTRRGVGLNCDENSNEPTCCRYPLTVNFDVMGFDFILAPKSYEAFYCAGNCPYLTLQKHVHTHLVTMASPNTVQPCCAPRRMRNITMIYYDIDGNVIVSDFPGMVVDRCGCS